MSECIIKSTSDIVISSSSSIYLSNIQSSGTSGSNTNSSVRISHGTNATYTFIANDSYLIIDVPLIIEEGASLTTNGLVVFTNVQDGSTILTNNGIITIKNSEQKTDNYNGFFIRGNQIDQKIKVINNNTIKGKILFLGYDDSCIFENNGTINCEYNKDGTINYDEKNTSYSRSLIIDDNNMTISSVKSDENIINCKFINNGYACFDLIYCHTNDKLTYYNNVIENTSKGTLKITKYLYDATTGYTDYPYPLYAKIYYNKNTLSVVTSYQLSDAANYIDVSNKIINDGIIEIPLCKYQPSNFIIENGETGFFHCTDLQDSYGDALKLIGEYAWVKKSFTKDGTEYSQKDADEHFILREEVYDRKTMKKILKSYALVCTSVSHRELCEALAPCCTKYSVEHMIYKALKVNK